LLIAAAIEGWISEEARGGAGVVEDVEPELAVFIAHARAAPDDLLELAHGPDDAREHHVLARGHVHAGGEHL